jgi:hypothetical protein
LGKHREAFTANRMVKRLSPIQENRMIQQALTEVDGQAIASALGTSGINHRMQKSVLKQLHPDLATALDQGKITRNCARELTHVKMERQKEILTLMETYNDFNLVFTRSLIVKTPPEQREQHKRRTAPWSRANERRGDLIKQLSEAEQKHDFCSRLYKRYTLDLLRVAIHVRSLLSNPKVREYLDQHHQAIREQFELAIAETKG